MPRLRRNDATWRAAVVPLPQHTGTNLEHWLAQIEHPHDEDIHGKNRLGSSCPGERLGGRRRRARHRRKVAAIGSVASRSGPCAPSPLPPRARVVVRRRLHVRARRLHSNSKPARAHGRVPRRGVRGPRLSQRSRVEGSLPALRGCPVLPLRAGPPGPGGRVLGRHAAQPGSRAVRGIFQWDETEAPLLNDTRVT